MARNSDSAPIARLKKRMDFLRCAQGKRQNMSGLALQWQPGPETRIGFTVSKKNGNAVKRNRIRRRLKAAVADIGQTGFPSGDHVVVARPDALTLPYTTLIKSLKSSAEALARKGARPHMAENRKTTQDR